MSTAARRCASCGQTPGREAAFELVCYCDQQHGVCRACFSRDVPVGADVATVRDHGWRVMGGQHALRRRVSPGDDSPEGGEPRFVSLALQDPAFLELLSNPASGRSPYQVYVSPALAAEQRESEEMKRRLEKSLVVFVVGGLLLAIWVYYTSP